MILVALASGKAYNSAYNSQRRIVLSCEILPFYLQHLY